MLLLQIWLFIFQHHGQYFISNPMCWCTEWHKDILNHKFVIYKLHTSLTCSIHKRQIFKKTLLPNTVSTFSQRKSFGTPVSPKSPSTSSLETHGQWPLSGKQESLIVHLRHMPASYSSHLQYYFKQPANLFPLSLYYSLSFALTQAGETSGWEESSPEEMCDGFRLASQDSSSTKKRMQGKFVCFQVCVAQYVNACCLFKCEYVCACLFKQLVCVCTCRMWSVDVWGHPPPKSSYND